MTKEELITKLMELENQRAFTYEDQMKLAILDKSPFTIWASDRDCKITLWEGQCEALYGYSRELAIGQDYISLFVAPDEQLAARRDQLSIIDNAAVFHNIANDHAKNGNTLQLVTNCFRIMDPRSRQYWNAEMGLIIDYLDQEKERLELIVAESRKVKSYITLFIESTQQRKQQFQVRKKAIMTEIATSERKAIVMGKRRSFREKVAPLTAAINNLQRDLYELIDDYYEKMQGCGDADACERVRIDFGEAYDDMLSGFEGIVLDFEELNLEFSGDNTVVQIKEAILKENYSRNIRLVPLASEILNKAYDEITEYRKIGDVNPNSQRLAKLTQNRDDIETLKNALDSLTDDILAKVSATNDNIKLQNIRRDMETQYSELDRELLAAKKQLEE
jgi:PAS domain S-box-containing protein